MNNIEDVINFPLRDNQLAELIGTKVGTIRSRKCILNREGILEEEIHYKIIDNPTHRSSKDFHIWLWLESGAIEIAKRVRTEKARKFLESRNINPIKGARIEYSFIDIIEAALEGITKCRRQHKVELSDSGKSYKIDLYLPEHGIAIECDESYHKDHGNQVCDIIRQKLIESDKGYEFVRFNPEEKNFDFGKILNKIFRKVIDDLKKPE